jgi:hypothetical protein
MAEILTRANALTQHNITSISEELLSVLRDLSEAVGNLKGDTSGTITSNGTYISEPGDLVPDCVDSLVVDEMPLNKISWSEYQDDVIAGYCCRDGKIYIRPTASSNRAYTLGYTRYHISTLTGTLEFSESFRDCILWGVIQKIYEGKERWDEAKQANDRYELYKSDMQSRFSPSVSVKVRSGPS